MICLHRDPDGFATSSPCRSARDTMTGNRQGHDDAKLFTVCVYIQKSAFLATKISIHRKKFGPQSYPARSLARETGPASVSLASSHLKVSTSINWGENAAQQLSRQVHYAQAK